VKIIQPSYDILRIVENLEDGPRVCYKSEGNKKDGSADYLNGCLIERGHESGIEHSSLSVRFICDRAFSHELVRHRLLSFSQESQRYCNYSQDRFGGEITFIEPLTITPDTDIYPEWYTLISHAESAYFEMLEHGLTPQEARCVLPNCTKTEMVVTGNFREWRHVLKLRTADDAHPEMRRLMIPLLSELKTRVPVIFDDILPESSQK